MPRRDDRDRDDDEAVDRGDYAPRAQRYVPKRKGLPLVAWLVIGLLSVAIVAIVSFMAYVSSEAKVRDPVIVQQPGDPRIANPAGLPLLKPIIPSNGSPLAVDPSVYLEPTEAQKRDVTDFLLRFAKATTNRKDDLKGYFDTSALRNKLGPALERHVSAQPKPNPDNQKPADVEAPIWSAISGERYAFWASTDAGPPIVFDLKLQQGVVETYRAAVGFPRLDGQFEPYLFDLREVGGEFAIFDWFHLRVGAGAADFVRAIVAGSEGDELDRVEWWAFSGLRTLRDYELLRELHDASKQLERLQRLLIRTAQEDLVFLAEARLAALNVDLSATHQVTDDEYFDEDEDGIFYDSKRATKLCERMIARSDSANRKLAAKATLARLYLQSNNPVDAISMCDEYVADVGNDPEILAIRGVAREQRGHEDGAKADFERALALQPKNADALDWQRRKRPEAKRPEIARVLAGMKQPDVLYAELRHRSVEDHDWPSAVALSEAFLERRPDSVRGHRELIQAAIEAKKPDKARKALKAAFPKIEPKQRSGLVSSFCFSASSHEFSEADYDAVPDEFARQAFSIFANRLEGMLHPSSRPEGQSKADREREKQAARERLASLCKRHRSRQPKDPHVAVFEAQPLVDSKKYAEAEAILAKALAVPRGDVTTPEFRLKRLHLEVLVELGRSTEATKLYLNDPYEFSHLLELLEKSGKAAELEKVVEASVTPPRFREDEDYWRGVVLLMRKKYAAAAVKFASYADEDDDSYPANAFAAREKLARCYLRDGQIERANRYAEKNESLPWPLRLAIFAAANPIEADDAILVGFAEHDFSKESYLLRSLYKDPDFAPIFARPAYDAFRKANPNPDTEESE